MQGPSREVTEQMVAAVRQVLENKEWKAGDYNVAYQVCDDSTAQAANYDTGKCSQNGNAYAVNDSARGRHRHVQLAVCGDHRPAPEQGQGRRGRDGERRGDPDLLAGEHVAVPDRQSGRRVRGERDGQVLPDDDA